MADPRTREHRTLPAASIDTAPYDEDFLFHLSRGSEMLVDNRVVEAKEELERALSFRPEDAKSQDLLAGVYFRLGVYPRSIDLWDRLVRLYPDDVTLRVNLGLALIKTGQPEEARAHLRHALSLEAEHPRAWGYMGLVLWREGRLEEARDAFTRGGQASMARRMSEFISSAPGVPASEVQDAAQARAQQQDVRDTAGAAIGKLAEPSALSVDADADAGLARGARRTASGSWTVTEAGVSALPRVIHAKSPVEADSPFTLAKLIEWWAAAVPSGQSLVVAPAGHLLLHTDRAVHSRRSGVRAMRGQPVLTPVARRYRLQGEGESLGGDSDPICRWEGALHAMIAPAPGDRFQAIRIEDDVLFVVERFVQAFDETLGVESGRLPQSAGAEPLVQFRGTGTLVLRVPRPPSAMSIRPGDEARVAPASLLGWTGRLFPLEEARQDEGFREPALALRGDGTAILV